MTMLVVAIPNLNGIGMRALAGMQHHKKIAFPTADGTKFKTTPIDFVYITTPHHNQERIDKAIALHQPRGDGLCGRCDAAYPCETVRVLTGENS